MKLLDILFGRTKPSRSKLEGLFAMATAYVTLTAKGELRPDERAAICFRPVESSFFAEAERELDGVLRYSAKATASKVETSEDSFGFRWIVFADPQFEDLVNTIHIVGVTLEGKGFRDQLLAAVFKFRARGDDRPAYWIYNYKRGAFYPFVPLETEQQRRDNAFEVRLSALMEKELPLEKDLEQWYALWGIPV